MKSEFKKTRECTAKKKAQTSFRMVMKDECLILINPAISCDTTATEDYCVSQIQSPFRSLGGTVGTRNPGVRGGRSEDWVQNEKWGGKEATKRVSMFLFQAFDVLRDWREENRAGDGEEEKEGAVGQVCAEELRWFHFLPAWSFSPSKLAPAIESQ